MPPESIYISEVKKTYESSSSHDLQQALPSSQLGIIFVALWFADTILKSYARVFYTVPCT